MSVLAVGDAFTPRTNVSAFIRPGDKCVVLGHLEEYIPKVGWILKGYQYEVTNRDLGVFGQVGEVNVNDWDRWYARFTADPTLDAVS